jgi:hypothetical protein
MPFFSLSGKVLRETATGGGSSNSIIVGAASTFLRPMLVGPAEEL